MVIFLLKIPGQFGEWCSAITAGLVEATLGSVAVINPATSDELATALIERESATLLVSVEQPGAWLQRLLARTKKPFVLSIDHPGSVASGLARFHGLGMPEVVRALSGSCAALMAFGALPGALVLRSEHHWQEPLATARTIADHLGLSIDPRSIESIVARIASAGLAANASQAIPTDSGEAAIAAAALSAYSDFFSGAALERITWTSELFLVDGQQPATQPVDVTGRVRALIYGPYVRLPPGNWQAEVVLGFSQEATEVNFVVDVLTGGSQLGVTSIRPPERGVFSVNLSFVIGEDNDRPVEFRVVNERAAFDGRIMLGHVTLTRQQGQSNADIERLKTELGLV